MAGAKEIRTKIASIRNTQKITKAMEMVATSKMRKAQDRQKASRPYANRIRKVISHIAMGSLEYKHPYTLDREVQRVGYVIISSDRGLCGGLNTNLFKQVVASMKEWQDQGVAIDLCLIGSKAAAFFKRFGGNIVAQVTKLGDAPKVADIIGVTKVMLDAHEAGTIDRLYLAHNVFVNTMTQQPAVEQLLPVQRNADDAISAKHKWDYLYEPDAKELLDMVMIRYVESMVYQGMVENIACEQAARMVAMKAATDNAGNIINELQLIYNKARQAAITQEISEIVSGAAAV